MASFLAEMSRHQPDYGVTSTVVAASESPTQLELRVSVRGPSESRLGSESSESPPPAPGLPADTESASFFLTPVRVGPLSWQARAAARQLQAWPGPVQRRPGYVDWTAVSESSVSDLESSVSESSDSE